MFVQTLRHSFATRLPGSGTNLRYIQEILEHKPLNSVRGKSSILKVAFLA